ncbi:hypothetical protein [Sphingobacterium sp.]|uniref:hypothetical protein n=1 Tax=Sphingobacterium sp. TaxID=341027 RepID=UPI0031D41E0C
MRELKNRLTLGLGVLGLVGGIAFANFPSNVSANAIDNAMALDQDQSPGECTGPKRSDCLSENTAKCSDMTGCNSSPSEPDLSDS